MTDHRSLKLTRTQKYHYRMTFKQIADIYYGPATQEFIEKHQLACPINPMWVDFNKLDMILFGKKTKNGGYETETLDGKTTHKIDSKSAAAKVSFHKRINMDNLNIIDDQIYVCFIDIICAAFSYNSLPILKEIAGLPAENAVRINALGNSSNNSNSGVTSVLKSLKSKFMQEPLATLNTKVNK